MTAVLISAASRSPIGRCVGALDGASALRMASEAVTRQHGLTLDQRDVIEFNKAFAAQGLADDEARVNPNGGAIAMGHPPGMSGARLVTTASDELARRGGRDALGTMCIGVGQGIALMIERIKDLPQRR